MGNCIVTLDHNNKGIFRMVIEKRADNTFVISEKDISNFISQVKFYGDSLESKLKKHFGLKDSIEQLKNKQVLELFKYLLKGINIDVNTIDENILNKINIFYSKEISDIKSFRNNVILSEAILDEWSNLNYDLFFYEILTAYTNNGTVEEKLDILNKIISKDHEFYKPIRDIIIQKDLEYNLYIKEIDQASQKFKKIFKSKKEESNFYEIYYNQESEYNKELKVGDIVNFTKYKGFQKIKYQGVFLENYNGFYIMLNLNNPDEIIVCEKDNIESVQYKSIDFDYIINKKIYKKGSIKKEFNKLIKNEFIKEEAEKYKQSGILFEGSILYDGSKYYKVTNTIITNDYTIYLLQTDEGELIRLNINESNSDELNKYIVIFDESVLSGKYYKTINNKKILTFNVVPFELRTLEYNILYDKIYSMIKNGDVVYVGDKKYNVNKVINNGFIQVFNEDNTSVTLIRSNTITRIETYNLLIDSDLDNLYQPLTFSYNVDGVSLNPIMYSSLALRKGYDVIIPTKENKSGKIEKDYSKIQFKSDEYFVYDTMQYQEYDIKLDERSIEVLNVGDIISCKSNDGNGIRYFYKIVSKLKDGSIVLKNVKISGSENNGYEYTFRSKDNIEDLNIDKLYTSNKKTISNFTDTGLKHSIRETDKLTRYISLLEGTFGIPVVTFNNPKGHNAYTDGKKIYLNIAKSDYLKHGTHEFIHIILGLIRHNDLELYYRIINNFTGSNFEEKEEAFVNQCMKKFKNEEIVDDYFKDVLDIIKNLVNSKNGISDFSKINLENFIDEYFSGDSYNFLYDLNAISDSIGYIKALDKIKMVEC